MCMIKKKENGNFEQTDSIVTSGDEVRSIAVKNFYLQIMILAGKSLETCPPNRSPSRKRPVRAGFRPLIYHSNSSGREEFASHINITICESSGPLY